MLVTRRDLREVCWRGGEELGDVFVQRLRFVGVRGELCGEVSALGGEVGFRQCDERGPRRPDRVMPADAGLEVIAPRSGAARLQLLRARLAGVARAPLQRVALDAEERLARG